MQQVASSLQLFARGGTTDPTALLQIIPITACYTRDTKRFLWFVPRSDSLQRGQADISTGSTGSTGILPERAPGSSASRDSFGQPRKVKSQFPKAWALPAKPRQNNTLAEYSASVSRGLCKDPYQPQISHVPSKTVQLLQYLRRPEHFLSCSYPFPNLFSTLLLAWGETTKTNNLPPLYFHRRDKNMFYLAWQSILWSYLLFSINNCWFCAHLCKGIDAYRSV